MKAETAIEYICNRIRNSDEFEDYYTALLVTSARMLFDTQSFHDISSESIRQLLRYTDFLSNSDHEYNRAIALKILSGIFDLQYNDNYVQLLTKSVLNKYGLFAADEKFVSANTQLPVSAKLESDLRRGSQRVTGSGFVYTNRQYEIANKILSSPNFSFSGPTSLGKSFVLKNVAIEMLNELNLIVFILPTKALLDEYLIDFRSIINSRKITNINLTKSVSGYKHGVKNILIFTQERYNRFIYERDYEDVFVDALFVDEAHKLADKNNNRSLTLFKVISHSLKRYEKLKIVFSSPVISNPEIFFDFFSISGTSLRIRESPVAQNLYFAELKNSSFKCFDNISDRVIPFEVSKKYIDDFDLIVDIGKKFSSNLIYISSKSQCMLRANDFYFYQKEKISDDYCFDPVLVEEANIISSFIHPEFSLSKMLPYGIAYHNGSLPSFIRRRIEGLYADRKIKYIFCTSTLLEGVNLPTKNIFIYPMKLKGESSDTLNFWNLAGRAGRYKNELSGNIICIDQSENTWSEQLDEIIIKKDVTVDNTIEDIVNSHVKILNYLTKDIKKPDSEIVEICSMLIPEIMIYNKTGNVGDILSRFSGNIRKKIIAAGNIHIKEKELSGIDISTFSENHRFSSNIQAKAYKAAASANNLLKKLTRQDVFSYLEMLNDIYSFRKPEYLIQLQIITFSWLSGTPLNQIITDSLLHSKKVLIHSEGGSVEFDKNNPVHINYKILDVINCIESEICFTLESSSAHFYQLCKSLHGESSCGYNLSSFLEYGTLNQREIALQEYGFSRAAAHELISSYLRFISFDENNFLVNINLAEIARLVKKQSLIYSEIQWLNGN